METVNEINSGVEAPKVVKLKTAKAKVEGLKKPKITGLKQLFAKKYPFLPNLSPYIKDSFGDLVKNFTMIVYGPSGNGKSTGMMIFLKELMNHGNALYVALEEGTASTMQLLALRTLNEDEHSGKIKWAESDMTVDQLDIKLKKKKSEQFVAIDSLQYWRITYSKWIWFKERHRNKTVIFVSHAKPSGNSPKGQIGEDIEYDVDVKCHAKGNVWFIRSRFGGTKPFIVNEEKARKYWGVLFEDIKNGVYEEAPNRPKADNKKPVKKAPRKKKVVKQETSKPSDQ